MTAARTEGMATMTKTAEKIRKKDDRIVGIIHFLPLDKFFGFGIIVGTDGLRARLAQARRIEES
jgi:hypothetical protein